MTTAIVVGIFFTLLLATFAVYALFLRLGLRLARVENVSKRRVAAATLAVFGVQVVMRTLSILSIGSGFVIALYFSEIVVGILASWAIIAVVFKIRLRRAIVAWLPTLLTSIAVLPAAILIVRPHLVEAYKPPTNSMAPTILGPHRRSTCPVCGQPAFGAPLEETHGEPLLICEAFHVSEVPEGNDLHSGDRFLVLKTIEPRRWDLIVFHYPEDPEVVFVKRLVGLPGETVTIDDGGVLRIDGERLTPPAELAGLRYENDMSGPWKLWGHPSRPARLGPDEYFVLGDFSLRSKDSRLWQDALPGHQPFAVPLDQVEGVVTHIYWPPARARVLR